MMIKITRIRNLAIKGHKFNGAIISMNGHQIICDPSRVSKSNKISVYIVATKKWHEMPLSDPVIKKVLSMLTSSDIDIATINRKNHVSSLMKHDRLHKKGTGSRERVNAITDYECSKYPLHDFPRSRYVQWN